MSLCHKCGKPVYFAERRTSLGREWHRQCLTCEECGKVLHPGQHAEHKGVPYCDVPCYGALFGPTMYGHGSPVEAHRSFGRPSQRSPKDSPKDSPIKRSDLEMRLQAYNSYHDGPSLQLSSRKVNGRLVVEGVLRVYWGVECPIQLQPKDDKPMPQSWRRSYHMAISNGLDEELLQRLEMGQAGMKRERSSLDDLFQAAMRDLEPETSPPVSPSKAPSESYKNVTMRKDKGRRRRSKRLSIFSGHLYDLETSVFTPTYGTVTSVRVTSVDPAQKVLHLLLDKFKVVNNPEDFCLCTVKQSGETHVLKDSSYPLLERVIMGPIENEAKIFIMERHRTQEISMEVAQFVNLPEPVLDGFLNKLDKDEEDEIKYLQLRYKLRQEEIQRLLLLPADSKDR